MPKSHIENVDLILNGKAQGDVMGYLMLNGRMDAGAKRPWINDNGKSFITVYIGGDPKKATSYRNVPINANATLRRDEWKYLDDAVLRVAETRLNGVQDLIDNNLTYNLGNGMGTTVLETHDIGDVGDASLSMDGISRGENSRPNYEFNYLPIPIIHFDYEINTRVLTVSRNMGNAIDTTMAERSARKCAEKLESMLFTDTSYKFGGGTIYSYVNHPKRNTGTFTAWNSSAATAAGMVADVLSMKQASINAHYYGPWMLYIPTAYETVIDADYDATTPGTTIRERIMKIANIKGIKVIDTLPADTMILVCMNTDVVSLVRGMAIQNVQWKSEGDMINNFKVMTIQVPQIRADQDGHSGIVHYHAA